MHCHCPNTYKGLVVMRLLMAPIGQVNQIKAIWLEDSIKNILEEVGLTVDCEVSVVLKPYEDTVIVGVKEKRIVLGEGLAYKIIV